MRSLFLLLLISMTSYAQVPTKPASVKAAPEEQPDGKPHWFKEPPPRLKGGKHTIPITITPNAVKKPLSKFYLTPQYTEMQPGNRVATFMKAVMEQDNFYAKGPRENRDLFNQMALEDLPLQEMRNSGCIAGLAYRSDKDRFHSRGRPLGDVDEGARQLSSDWQIWFNIREDGYHTLLPEVQKMREHASCLKVRMRYEIRTGEIDKAIYTARTYYGLSSSLESHPTLIGNLVGTAIQLIAFSCLEELIQQPNCPNLYWSFMEMPTDVLSSRLASQSERLIGHPFLKPFLDATGPMTEEEIYKHLKPLESLDGEPKGNDPFPNKYALNAGIRSTDKKKLAAAKKLLVETGMKPTTVEKFAEMQLIITADIREYETILDELMISHSLPHPAAVKQTEAVMERVKKSDNTLLRLLVPSNRNIVSAKTRLKQHLAYLRTLEAIRLYAHENEGKLPSKLADCTVLVPMDPVTEKPFEYSVKDGIATLHGASPSLPTEENRYYEIRVRK